MVNKILLEMWLKKIKQKPLTIESLKKFNEVSFINISITGYETNWQRSVINFENGKINNTLRRLEYSIVPFEIKDIMKENKTLLIELQEKIDFIYRYMNKNHDDLKITEEKERIFNWISENFVFVDNFLKVSKVDVGEIYRNNCLLCPISKKKDYINIWYMYKKILKEKKHIKSNNSFFENIKYMNDKIERISYLKYKNINKNVKYDDRKYIYKNNFLYKNFKNEYVVLDNDIQVEKLNFLKEIDYDYVKENSDLPLRLCNGKFYTESFNLF